MVNGRAKSLLLNGPNEKRDDYFFFKDFIYIYIYICGNLNSIINTIEYVN